jgi:hypothetical protein
LLRLSDEFGKLGARTSRRRRERHACGSSMRWTLPITLGAADHAPVTVELELP